MTGGQGCWNVALCRRDQGILDLYIPEEDNTEGLRVGLDIFLSEINRGSRTGFLLLLLLLLLLGDLGTLSRSNQM